MRLLLPIFLLIATPVFACCAVRAESVLADSGALRLVQAQAEPAPQEPAGAEQPSHGKTWVLLTILLVVFVLGGLTKARLARKAVPDEKQS